jgi:hypothetical protein
MSYLQYFAGTSLGDTWGTRAERFRRYCGPVVPIDPRFYSPSRPRFGSPGPGTAPSMRPTAAAKIAATIAAGDADLSAQAERRRAQASNPAADDDWPPISCRRSHGLAPRVVLPTLIADLQAGRMLTSPSHCVVNAPKLGTV